MKVILLCAGYATRLYPLTKDHPKPLLPVGGRPILAWTLDRLKEIQEIEGVYLVTNERFTPHFEKWAAAVRYPWEIKVINDQTTSNENRLGAIGDLRYVLAKEKMSAEDLLVIAGDNFFDSNLKELLSYAVSKRPYPVVAVYDVKERSLARHYGIVQFTEKEGRVKRFYEKPSEPPATTASCGLYWFPKEASVFLDKYLADGHNPDQPGHYMGWLVDHNRLYAAPLKGRWFDIGDPQSYEKANSLFPGISKTS